MLYATQIAQRRITPLDDPMIPPLWNRTPNK